MTTAEWADSWLVGARCLHRSADAVTWEEAGGQGLPVNDIVRLSDRVVCANNWGLWEVDAAARWTQLHDETLTEVLSIASAAGDPGVVAASVYGLTFGERGEHGVTRWQSHSDGLSLESALQQRRPGSAGGTWALAGWHRGWRTGVRRGCQGLASKRFERSPMSSPAGRLRPAMGWY